MKAAIFHGPHQPLTIEEVEIDRPMAHEVLIRTAASGVCHSDLHYVDGHSKLPPPGAPPAILGHEAAGIVEAVGEQVTYVKPGDHVICCTSVFCGQCEKCLTGHPNLCTARPLRKANEPPILRLGKDGTPVFQFANVASFAEKMLLHENAVVKIDDDFPLDRAALIGCAVITGFGAAINTAKVEPGSTVAVFGAGGVGLSVIQGARVAGARMIIAVDTLENKLAMAKDLGATHTVDASSRDPVAAIIEMTDGGVDYSFEAIGFKQTAEQAFASIRRGGTATLIGVISPGVKLEIDGRELLGEKKLQGSIMGSNRFRVDMPRIIDFYRQGRVKLDEMITRRGRLEDVNEAFRAMQAGEVARSVLMFD